MKQWRGFILGCLTMLIVMNFSFIYGNSMEKTLNVLINSINLEVDGKVLAEKGNNILLDDGTDVPYTILYKGTTYIPLRKVTEALGQRIEWDSNGATVRIKSELDETVQQVDQNNLKNETNRTKEKKTEAIRNTSDTSENQIEDEPKKINATMRLTYKILTNNHVGNEWGAFIKYMGEYYFGSTINIEIDKSKDLEIILGAYEHDDGRSDFGQSDIYISKEELSNNKTIVKSQKVTVIENGGRYTGNSAEVEVTLELRP